MSSVLRVFSRDALVRASLFVVLSSAGSCAEPPQSPAGDQAAMDGSVGSTVQPLGTAPEADCVWAQGPTADYFFCPTNRNWQDAQTRCEAVGLGLAVIDDAAENDFIRQQVQNDAWIGASDQVNEGLWTWGETGVQFWQGDEHGAAVDGAFERWKWGQPNDFAGQDCALLDEYDGEWSDEDCGDSRDYVCESFVDACPDDPAKTDPAQCGCGVPDVDTDGDGTADCNDECPADPLRTELDCSPDSDCELLTHGGSQYFFCRVRREWQDARAHCEAVGWKLTRVDDAAEEDFIASHIGDDRWIGGSDLAAEGQWVWEIGGDQFWQGDEGGSPVGGLYSNWDYGDPDDLLGQDCLQILGNGELNDDDCDDREEFICEDLCPADTAKAEPGLCGCGVPDTDSDADGIPDCQDADCPNPGCVRVGSPCADDADCESIDPTAYCDGQFPGGYCTLPCDGTAGACPEATRCFDASYCVFECDAGGACSEADQSCSALDPPGGEPFCRPTCAPGCPPDTRCTADALCTGCDATDPSCDAIDQDCDGVVDDDYAVTSSTCGTGACAASGELTCVDGGEQDTCVPGTPAADDATCDGTDDDCDDALDEDYLSQTTSCGVGACAASGTTTCDAGSVQDSCQPGTPAAADASCDGVDDDCDQSLDEDYVAVTTLCGIGACAATGASSCVLGSVQDSCVPGTPAASDATCDGIDDDCDGAVDDDYLATPTGCAVGACTGTGALVCTAGALVDTCAPDPGCESLCDDGADNDADGAIDCQDTDCTADPACGPGAPCTSDSDCGGDLICTTEGVCAACALTDATCDGLDDDCDGMVDDDYVASCDGDTLVACVDGAVQSTPCVDGDVCNGTETCSAGACQAGTPLELDDGNPCTDDACDPMTGLSHTEVAEGTACDDGDVCNGGESCLPSCQPGESVLLNASFEAVPDGSTGPGLLPDEWVARAGTPSTHSDDGSYGEPSDVSAGAADGLRYLELEGDVLSSESAGQLLAQPLQPGVTYTAQVQLHNGDSKAAEDATARLQLASESGDTFANLGTFDPVYYADNGAWHQRTLTFVAPANAADLPWLVVAPGTVNVDGFRSVGTIRVDALTVAAECDTSSSTGLTCQPDPASPAPALDDGNECTIDSCDPVTGVSHVANEGVSCDDGDACTDAGTCDAAGACQPGAPLPLPDDGNDCTEAVCDPVTGVSHVPLAAGTACDDADHCSAGDACDGSGACVAGADPPTGLPTSDATCDGVDDDCDGIVDEEYVSTTTSCGVGACAATGQLMCVGGVEQDSCAPGTPAPDDAICDDVDEDCDGAVDEHYAPTDTYCGVNACSSSGQLLCNDGILEDTCVPGAPAPDDSTCDFVDDDCDYQYNEDFQPTCQGTATTTCQGGAVRLVECDDANLCNGDETCEGGVCQPGVPLALDDGDPCTTDGCDPVLGPVYTQAPYGTSCDDGNACNGPDTCQCTVATGNLLRNPSFEEVPSTETGAQLLPSDWLMLQGLDIHTMSEDGSYGLDGSGFNGLLSGAAEGIRWVRVGEYDRIGQQLSAPLVAGASYRVSAAINPGDGAMGQEPETFQVVLESGDGTVVELGEFDSTSEPGAWAAGTLCFTAPATVDQLGYLSLRARQFAAGSTDTHLDQVSLERVCGCGADALECLPDPDGVVEGLDDGNDCTSDSCDPATGEFSHTPVAAGVACDDGNLCTEGSACDGSGVCVTGTPLDTPSDSNPCTIDGCDPARGFTYTPDIGSSCDDGDLCTQGTSCDSAGLCTGGTAVDVDDGDQCTVDDCDPATGPQHTPVAGLVCDDANLCTMSDVCTEGSDGTIGCVGTAISVDDSNACTIDTCDPLSGAVHTPDVGATCDDANLCTVSDTCDSGGACVGTPVDPDDGNECTTDACDPGIGVLNQPAPGAACGTSGLCDDAATCTEPACDDGVDDDDDGQIDCADTDCADYITCLPEICGNSIDDNADGLADCADHECDGDPACAVVPDPVAVAPPVDNTTGSRFLERNRFLMEGPDPVQRGVDPALVFPPAYSSRISGYVRDELGSPLPGVRVTVQGRSDLGFTYTRADGAFDMLLDGAGRFLIDLRADGYIPAQKEVKSSPRGSAPDIEAVLITRDTQVTTLDVSGGTSSAQVAESSEVTDADGPRAAAAIVLPGTAAQVQMPDGTRQNLSTMSLRITEHTVGPDGAERMPAPLPPTSAYTYMIDITADEVEAFGGLKRDGIDVILSQPVPVYVGNFLDAMAGTRVPTGYYDSDAGVWKSIEAGTVVKIVSITDGLADLDIDGDDVADDVSALIDVAERQSLAGRYAVGDAFTRVALPHFSSYDFNYGVALAEEPRRDPPKHRDEDGDKPKNECAPGSTIRCQDRVIGEDFPLTGTPFALHYESDRVLGYRAGRRFTMALDPTEYSNVTGVRAMVIPPYGSPQRYRAVGAAGDLVYEWNGLDREGRQVLGHMSVDLRIGYEYECVYRTSYSFGNRVPAQVTGDVVQATAESGGGAVLARAPCFLPSQTQFVVQQWDNRILGLGGMSITPHHVLEESNHIRFGDGSTSESAVEGAAVSLGFGDRASSGAQQDDVGPDDASMFSVYDSPTLDVSPQGIVYFTAGRRVRAYDPTTDTVRTVAGTYDGSCVETPIADGTPMLDAPFCTLQDLAVGPDGDVYVADGVRADIYRIRIRDGVVERMAGGPAGAGSNVAAPGDGDLDARDATLRGPNALFVDPGSQDLYFHDGTPTNGHPNPVYRVDTNGKLWRVLGGGSTSINLLPTDLETPIEFSPRDLRLTGGRRALAGDGDGGFYLLGASGPMIRVTKTFDGVYALPRPRVQDTVSALRTDRAGRPHVLHRSVAIDRLEDDGWQQVFDPSVEDDDRCGYRHGEFPAHGIAVAPNGDFYFAYPCYGKSVGPGGQVVSVLRRKAPALNIASPDGTRYFVFDERRRHVATRHALTGGLLYRFHYVDDPSGPGSLLSQIEDGDGNLTAIERDGGGVITGVLSADGQRTSLAVDTEGYISSYQPDPTAVQAPFELDYYSGAATGLLRDLTDPRGHTKHFTYDEFGKLERDEHTATSFTAFTETEDVVESRRTVTKTTTNGRQTVYDMQGTGPGDRVWTVTEPDGTSRTTTVTNERSTHTVHSNGMESISTPVADPRFGFSSELPATTTTLPRGSTRTVATDTEVLLSDQDDPGSLTTWVRTTLVNGRPWVSEYDPLTRVLTQTSPEGRITSTLLDSQGRPIEVSVPGLETVVTSYDARGRIESVTQGSGAEARIVSYDYRDAPADPQDPTRGYLERVDGPRPDDATAYAQDAVGRVTVVTSGAGTPDTGDDQTVAMAYDGTGDLVGVTTPRDGQHGLGYTEMHQQDRYTAPRLDPGDPDAITETLYEYSDDRDLQLMTDPGGRTVDYIYGYDEAGTPQTGLGQLERVVFGDTEVQYGYDPVSGQVDSIDRVDAMGLHVLGLTYDGPYLDTASWGGDSGLTTGSVGRSYDNDLRLRTLTVTDAGGVEQSSVMRLYDGDGLLTSAGALSLRYDVDNGLLEGMTLDQLDTARAVNGFGELEALTVSLTTPDPSELVYEESISLRDAGGRIRLRDESWLESGSALSSASHEYQYDVHGRLERVFRDGTQVGEYTYYENGNRLEHVTDAGVVRGSYDPQDRLDLYCPRDAADETLAAPDGVQPCFDYAYLPSGELQSKLDLNLPPGSNETTYAYDEEGALREATLPDSTVISYEIDSQGRRVGKWADAGDGSGPVKQWGLLYRDGLNPIAELDASNAVVNVFVYGSKPHVPDYMVQVSDGAVFQLISDHLGSVRMVVNAATGEIVQRLAYDEFGNATVLVDPALDDDGVISVGETLFQPFGFAGGLYDPDTGLVRFGARDYDPVVGRWTAKDPILFDGGQANLYVYVGNDPVNRVDPSGLWDLFLGVEGEAILAGGVSGTAGLVWDLDSPEQCGGFVNTGGGVGLNIGAGTTVGVAIREVEGYGENLDFNIGPVGVTFLFDEQGFNGIAIGPFGVGAGVSYGAEGSR